MPMSFKERRPLVDGFLISVGGATATIAKLSSEEQDIALRATKILGLSVAGVDILRSKRGPLVLEVNASPGLEGIEATTKVDIAGKIISFIEKNLNSSE